MSPVSKIIVQPGRVLNEVLVGALRAKGTTFSEWCRVNGVGVSAAKAATYGFSGGDRGRAIVEAMIAEAGRSVVEEAYRRRIMAEAAKLQQVA